MQPDRRLNDAQLRALARIRTICIDHPRANRALGDIMDFHALGRLGEDPGFLAFIGHSGSGKTTIAKTAARLLSEQADDASPRPCVYFRVPETCTRKALVSNLLEALGDPDAASGTREQMIRRVRKLIARLGVQLVIVDELQHLVSQTNRAVNYSMADLLKSLMDETAVPFVLVGLPELDRVISVNSQLHRRMHGRIELAPFGWETSAELEEFRRFLALYDRALPFPEYCFLADGKVVLAMYQATGGYVGLITRIAKTAAEHAIRRGARRIEVEHLSMAWRELQEPYSKRRDPFQGLELPSPRPKPVDGNTGAVA